MNVNIDQPSDVLTVSKLNFSVRNLLESHYRDVWIEGEISNLVQPSSGHLYFSLKDSKAQVRCAMFKTQSRWLPFKPLNGQEVLLKARVSVYPDRGDYQLIVEKMQIFGEGALKKAYELLLQHLANKGYFQDKWKQAIPKLPKVIGVISSPTGAAIRDVINVLARRYPIGKVQVYPTKVQGSEAASEIIQAIDLANRTNQCQVIVLCRGGGSIEDLWAFNNEALVEAIFASKIPIISGIGHEIDFTLSDLVADLRAPTPSAAAELASPDQSLILSQLHQSLVHASKILNQQILKLKQTVLNFSRRIRHPGQKLIWQQQALAQYKEKLARIINNTLKTQQLKLRGLAKQLHSLSPLATLGRGYAIVCKKGQRIPIKSSHGISISDQIEIRLEKDLLECQVTKIIAGENDV